MSTGAAPPGPIILLEHVSRVYWMGDAEVRALDDVSLSIARGEFVAVMGPSGSGKSTLLNVLGCLDSPSAGRYLLEGEPVEHLSEDRLAEVRQRRLGFVFQTFQLVARMTALRNVELPMVFAGIPAPERRERANQALHAVGLGARTTHRPDQLSGGERQRVAIARSIVMEPTILFADEPTGNLDTAAGGEIVALIQGLHERGLSVILVTHDPTVAASAQRIVRMRDGRIVGDEVAAMAERGAP